MPTPVQLYVYDLSNGLAKALSLQLTGKQLDGIWHTSVVVFGKEIFYGQGISITEPGRSHHGKPLQVIDMGQTDIDEDTLEEYLSEMRGHYTADKYHLLEFNCNSFTNDVIGFLTGGSIPSWIKDLPTDFLSTPFGASLRPTIDNMYRRPVPGVASSPAPSPAQAAQASPNPQLAASLLQAVAQRAATAAPSSSQPSQPPANPATSTLTAPIHIATNPSSLHSLLNSHRAVVACFTSQTCAPRRMIEPVFEDLAASKGRREGVAFAKVDLGVGMGGQVATEWGVRVTPTFVFWLDGKKTHELKGADAAELRTQIDMLLFEAFPPHPHSRLSLPSVEAISLNPILFAQPLNLNAVLTKLNSFISATPSWPSSLGKEGVQDMLINLVKPYLQARFPKDKGQGQTPSVPATAALLNKWAEVTKLLVEALPAEELFPLVDMWRLALLDEVVSGWAAALDDASGSDPLSCLLTKAPDALERNPPPRSYLLTLLRLLSNAFGAHALARRLLYGGEAGTGRVTGFLIGSLLSEDVGVRTAAASLAFNVAAVLQKGRVERARSGMGGGGEDGNGEWEVEVVSAVVEAIGREAESEEVVHRLTACLALFLRLSPLYEENLAPLLEVLQTRDVLKGKLEHGGLGEKGVEKKEVRKLVEEVADKLCP